MKSYHAFRLHSYLGNFTPKITTPMTIQYRIFSPVSLYCCNVTPEYHCTKYRCYILLVNKRFTTGNGISIQTEELLKTLIANNSPLNLQDLCIEAVENATTLRELSMIIYSTVHINLDFHAINKRIIYLLPSESFSNILVLMRVLIDTEYVISVGSIFTELVSRYLLQSVDDITMFCDVDLSNYMFVYSKLVDRGLIKSSIQQVESIVEKVNSRIEKLQPYNFCDILQSLALLKPINVSIDAEKVLNYIFANMKCFSTQEIISTWYSVVSFNFPLDHQLFINFSHQLLNNDELFSQIDVECMVRLITAIGRSRINDIKIVKLIDNLIPQIRKMIEMEKIGLYECSKILVALNNCNYKCDSLLHKVSKYFRHKYQELPNDDDYAATIVNLCIGFGRSLFNDKRVFNVISQLLLNIELLNYLSTQELINVVQSFAKVRLLDNKLMAHIHKVLESRIGDTMPLELCIKYIHSVSILEFKHYNVQKKVVEIIEQYHNSGTGAMNEFQIAKVCYAASKLDIPCGISVKGMPNLAKSDGLWVVGYSGRKTSHIAVARKPIHVRRMKKIW